MAKKRNAQPDWITAMTKEVTEEILEHVLVRIDQLEQDALKSRHDLRPGQLRPALIAAIQDTLRDSMNAVGQDAVDRYTEVRTAAGTPAKTAQGEELGPLLGLSRGGVYAAFGRAR